jgi:hypothetical protein
VSDPDLISAAIRVSGLSLTRFAEDVMSRDARTLFRWREGNNPIPPVARRWLERYVAERMA